MGYLLDTLNKVRSARDGVTPNSSTVPESELKLDWSKLQIDKTDPKEQLKFLPGSVISSRPEQAPAYAGGPSGIQQSPMKRFFQDTPLGEALFGSEGGKDPLDTDRGFVGFFYEFLSKDTADNYFDRYDKLIEEGVEPERAHEVTVSNLFEDSDIELSDTEKTVLRNRALIDLGGSALESLDFVTGGMVSKGGRLSIKTLDRLFSTTKKSNVSVETIEGILKQPDIKQAEKDIVRLALEEVQDAGKVNVRDLADKVNSRLLPLNPTQVSGEWLQYENISLPPEQRGEVIKYQERLFQSPIENTTGQIHFGSLPPGVRDKYFAHTRIEDIPGDTRRVIEVQSDLFQKGRLESEKAFTPTKEALEDIGVQLGNETDMQKKLRAMKLEAANARNAELSQLSPYRNIWHERVIREEVKKAAEDGIKTLRFPTGETAMKIEGLGDNTRWFDVALGNQTNAGLRYDPLTVENLEVGKIIDQGDEFSSEAHQWMITEVGEDGKFKAVQGLAADNDYDLYNLLEQRGHLDDGRQPTLEELDSVVGVRNDKEIMTRLNEISESFDISGKVDTNNPIYRFYEKNIAKYLNNKYDAKVVTDEQGVTWSEIKVDPKLARQPVEAFGGVAGVQQDEEGDITFDPSMAALGVLGIAGAKKLNKSQAKRSKELLPGDISPKDSSFNTLYLAPRVKTMKETWTKVVEYVQNTEERLRQLKDPLTLADAKNPYQKMALMHGKMGTRIEEGYDAVREVAEDVVDYVGRNKVSVAAGRKEVNQYLQALHAPERNAVFGDGAAGMKTADAKEITEKASAQVKAVAKKVLELNSKTLDMLRDSGVISDDLYKTLRERYKNHVPLQRVFEGDDMGQVLGGSTGGLDVRSSGVKAAKGSELEVADILTNVTLNYEQAVIRSEKNIVDQSTLAFVREEVEKGSDGLAHLFEVKKPTPIGQRSDGSPVFQQNNDPQVLRLFEEGKPIEIHIKDPNLAVAMKGVGSEKLGPFMRAVGTFTRVYSGLATRFNPEFAFSNKIRDLQETITYLGSQEDVSIKALGKTLVHDPANHKAVLDGIRGADTPGAKLYREMKEAGGTTGGLGLSTREQVDLDIDKIFATARSRPRKAAQKLVEYVDNWNTIFEDSTRLSVYKAAKESGLSTERAAFLAKEASINFNRRGKGGPVINSLWMFSNASIQGTFKILRAMRNPKVAAGVAASVGSSVAAVSEWNDRVDPNWRNAVSEWDRNSNLPIMLPTEDGSARYVIIPVSWGLKPVMVASNTVYDIVSGVEVDLTKNLMNVFSSIIDAYNPLGGSDPLSGITPTILDVPFDIARNKKWSGSKIRPDYDPSAPKDIQYFPSLLDTAFGQAEVKATRELADATGILISPADMDYALNSYMSGAGRSIKKTSNLILGVSTEDAPVPPADEWPFVSRFLRQRDVEQVGQGAGGEVEILRELKSQQSRERFLLKEEARGVKAELDTLPKEVAEARFNVLIETNPELAKKVNEIVEDEKLGRTYEDSLIMALGVANGERAKYIHSKMVKLKTDEQRAKLWEEYVQKKIISKNVAEQLKELLNS